MRLIDADELIIFGLDNPDCEHLFEFVPKEFVDNADTVEAIPIEWIRDYVSIWISEPYKNFALNMITQWEKENEAD